MALSRRLSALVRPDLVTAAARFPAPIAMTLVATVLIVLSVEEVIPRNSERLERAFYGAGAVFLAGVACGILLEGRGAVWRVAGQLAAVALGTAAALALHSPWLMPPFLLASLALLVIAAPGFAAGGTPIRFWVFNVRSAFAALVGAVGAGAFVFGFWAILATLRALFDLTVPARLVSHAAAVGFVLVLPLYWLAFQPRVQDLDAEEPPADILLRAVAALTDFVFLPLLVIYTVILHIYAAKIAIEAALPRGQIGWMASIFLGLGYFVFLLAVPRQGRLARLRESFRLAWPPATLVPAGLLAVALRERVQAYGVTEERYLIGVAAAMAAVLFLGWLPKRRLDPRLVPAVAAGLLLVAAAGPLSAPLLTVRSQAERFTAVLDASGWPSGCRYDPERPTAWHPQARSDLQSIIQVLERRRALHLITPRLGMPPSVRGREISACLDFERPYGRSPSPGVSPPLIQSFVEYVRIDSDILLGRFSSGATQMVVFRTPDGPEYTLKVEGQRAVLSGPAGTFSFDLTAEPVVGTGSAPRVVRADDPRAALIVHVLRWDGAGAERRPGLLSGEILLRRASP